MEYLKLQNVTLSNNKKRRFRKTPVMTLEGCSISCSFGWQDGRRVPPDRPGRVHALHGGDALFELEIRERKLALEQGNWHERRSAPSSATGLGEERRFHSRAAVEKHSMKCVCAKALCLRLFITSRRMLTRQAEEKERIPESI